MGEFSGGLAAAARELAPALISLGLALLLRRLPYGSSLGVRTQRTLQGEAHWRYAHDVGARVLLLAATALALVSRSLSPVLMLPAMLGSWILAVLIVAWVPPRKEPMP